MSNEELIVKLTNKLKQLDEEFDSIINDPQIRNIAFGSAGCLSKASKNRLYRHRDKIGVMGDKVGITKLALKIAQGEPFTRFDLDQLRIDFLLRRTDDYDVFYTDAIPIRIIREMINEIADIFHLPYKRVVFKNPLIFNSLGSNSICEIPLNTYNKVENLSQLKKRFALFPTFEIVAHHRPECVGQKRRVNGCNTQCFYSIIPSEPNSNTSLANDGKGVRLDWGKASFWEFKDNIASVYTSNEIFNKDTLIMSMKLSK